MMNSVTTYLGGVWLLLTSLTVSADIRYHYLGPDLMSVEQAGVVTDTIYAGGQPLANIDNGKIRFRHTNRLGRTVATTDGAGAILDRQPAEPGSNNGTPDFNLPGHYSDTETGLAYNGGRYYDSETQRYNRPDPLDLADNTNRYAYGLGDGVNHLDRNGYCVEQPMEAFSLATGLTLLTNDLYHENYWGVAFDVLGLGMDVVLSAIPCVPGGVSLINAGSRGATRAATQLATTVGKQAAEHCEGLSLADDAVEGTARAVQDSGMFGENYLRLMHKSQPHWAAYLRNPDRWEGFFDVFGHGHESGLSMKLQVFAGEDASRFGSSFKLQARSVAFLLRQHPGYEAGTPLRLMSCFAGCRSGGFAQQLADEMGVVVAAPKGELIISERGNGILRAIAHDGTRMAPDELWEFFTPSIWAD